MKTYLTTTELAKKLNVTRQSIYNWIKKGLPFVKVGSVIRFDPDQVQEWIDSQN